MSDNFKYQYSYTRIDTFLKCPQAFRLKYVDKIPEIKTPALRIGGLAHEVIEGYMKHLLGSRKERDVEQGLGILNSRVTECSEMEFVDLKAIVEEFIGSHYLDFSFQTDFMVEQQLAFDRDWKPVDDWFGENVFWRSVMDCLHWEQDLLVITDYKTNRQIDQQSVIDNSLQLLIYAWISHLLYPDAENILIRLDYVRHSVYRKRLVEMAEILEVPERIDHFVELIEKEEEFKPQVSSYCDYCSFQNSCQAFQNLMEATNGRLETYEDAQKLATRVRAMESFIKQSKDKLKNWIEMNQPIEVGNERLDFHRSEEKSFDDPYAVVQKLGSLGMTREQIWPMINLARIKVKSAMSKAGIVSHWEEVESLLTENIKTKFGFEKVKE